MPAEPKPAPTERGASDEAEREKMTIEIEDGDSEAKKVEETAEQAKADQAEGAQGASKDEGSADEQASKDSEGSTGAQAEAQAADDGAVKLQEELEKAKAEAQEWQDKFLRLHAEWDTYRRRTAEQREAEKARASEKLVTGLLPVIDDFERTISYAIENGEIGLLDGVRAVHTKFVDVLKKDGVEVIDPSGEAFDALQHQAVATVPDEEAFDETVHDVYQKGYKLGDKILRPAMVTVTTGGPERPKEESSEEE